jgi:hypothetical protein
MVRQGRYEFTLHAQLERLADDLDVAEIEQVIAQGELLEEYPDAPRGRSCLLLGYAGTRPVHVVLGWAGDGAATVLRIVTVYLPEPPRWSDPRTRGEDR